MAAMGRDLPVAEHLSSVATNVSDGGMGDVQSRRARLGHYHFNA